MAAERPKLMIKRVIVIGWRWIKREGGVRRRDSPGAWVVVAAAEPFIHTQGHVSADTSVTHKRAVATIAPPLRHRGLT